MTKPSNHEIAHPAWKLTETTGLWYGQTFESLRRAFARSEYSGYIKEYGGPIRFDNGGLGAWTRERMFPHSETRLDEYVVLHILCDPPRTKFHGSISRENILAHMLMHVERGSQCSAVDPQDWNVECRIVEFEAMNRMVWHPGNCDTFNPFNKELIEWNGPDKGCMAAGKPRTPSSVPAT